MRFRIAIVVLTSIANTNFPSAYIALWLGGSESTKLA